MRKNFSSFHSHVKRSRERDCSSRSPEVHSEMHTYPLSRHKSLDTWRQEPRKFLFHKIVQSFWVFLSFTTFLPSSSTLSLSCSPSFSQSYSPCLSSSFPGLATCIIDKRGGGPSCIMRPPSLKEVLSIPPFSPCIYSLFLSLSLVFFSQAHHLCSFSRSQYAQYRLEYQRCV